jgi:hypothetical protein
LEKPFPVHLKQGDKVWQKVVFTAESELLPAPESNSKAIEIIALEKKSQLVQIGIAASTELDTLTPEMIDALQALHLHHYRIEVQPSSPDWKVKFKLDCDTAAKLKLPLEIALHISDPHDLELLYEVLEEFKPVIRHIILLRIDHAATDDLLIQEVRAMKKRLPDTAVGAGTDYNYRELNCNRFDAGNVDFISYSIDPQEHATDDLTIVENISAQADTVQSARDLYGESKAIHISSLTLRKRFNPAATVSEERLLPNDQKADPRQETKFASAFTLGSIKTLSQANANAVTLYQTVGKQGILSAAAEAYPVYTLLHEIQQSGATTVIHTVSSKPLDCDALLLHNGEVYTLLLANYTPLTQRVVFRRDEYTLEPYEVRKADIQ